MCYKEDANDKGVLQLAEIYVKCHGLSMETVGDLKELSDLVNRGFARAISDTDLDDEGTLVALSRSRDNFNEQVLLILQEVAVSIGEDKDDFDDVPDSHPLKDDPLVLAAALLERYSS